APELAQPARPREARARNRAGLSRSNPTGRCESGRGIEKAHAHQALQRKTRLARQCASRSRCGGRRRLWVARRYFRRTRWRGCLTLTAFGRRRHSSAQGVTQDRSKHFGREARMAQLNAEYGSELHLLRMLGRHRTFLDRSVCEAMKADAVEWQDFPSGEKHTEAGAESAWDREWQRLDFLPDGDLAKAGWPTVWPAHRQGQSWDAIGRVTIGGAREWLLVEAKANIEELKSSCGAADPVSRDLIERTLADTKRAIGVAPDCDWLSGYYQFCNRLVVLRWLNENG